MSAPHPSSPVVTGLGEVLFSLVSEVGHVQIVVMSSGKHTEFVQGIHLGRQQLGPLVGRWAARFRLGDQESLTYNQLCSCDCSLVLWEPKRQGQRSHLNS